MFKRNYLSPIYFLFLIKYDKLITPVNIKKYNKRKLKKIFKNEEKRCVSTFIHNIVTKYHEKNEVHSFYYLDTLKKLIRKLDMKLNFNEEQNLLSFEEQVFTKSRAIKTLDTNFKLLSRETTKGIFELSHLYVLQNNFYKEIFFGKLLITNQRIIIWKQQDAMKFIYKEMRKIEYLNYGFKFSFQNIDYLIRIHDHRTLNMTIKKIIKRYKGSK